MATRQEAKAIVLRIAKRYGYLDEQMMCDIEQWKPEYRRAIEESSLAKDNLAGHSIKTLAKNIYGSDARFVFELLQNADDNRYTRATASGTPPSFSFSVYRDRIVTECNEDGFTEENLQAICSVGESTKASSHGYIGAKGIGFKSVFIAARKVEIQSGHFTFSFKHEKGGSGLGMVLPIWNDNSGDELPSPLTRMTLYVHNDGDEDELRNLRQTIVNQLADLQSTCLLFLQNIKRIRVTVHGEDDMIINEKTFSSETDESNHCWLETQDHGPGGEAIQSKAMYHITSYIARNVPKSDNREYVQEDVSKLTSNTNIILAFPLSAESNPVIENQHIFAFLPVRESGFKFLIQSDFDTSANRQDILTTSRRNIYLRDEIANAFIQAILELCEHSDLCYSWPEYLPQPGDNLGSFWSALEAKLRMLVKVTPCLRSRHSDDFRKPGEIYSLAPNVRDENNQPLLDDISLDPFISPAYSTRIISKLRSYGLRNTTLDLFLDLLEKDIADPLSKMQSPSTTDKWHSAIASILLKHFASCGTTLKRLEILPLRGGGWRSAQLNPVVFPYTGELLIPEHIALQILSPAATENPHRAKLFSELGVVEASKTAVRSSILDCYKSPFSRPTSVTASNDHLRYLYLSRSELQRSDEIGKIAVFCKNRSFPQAPQDTAIYLPSTHPLAPEKLLVSTNGKIRHHAGYIHPLYLEDPPHSKTWDYPSWKEWLVDDLKVRERLSIFSANGATLSDEWHFVYKHHPRVVLELLEYLWKFEGERISTNENIRNEIMSLRANELCATDITEEFELSSTWLPTPDLTKQVDRYIGSRKLFPFLDFGDSGTTVELNSKWKFLAELGVGMQDDVFFLLDILYHISEAATHSDQATEFRALIGVFIAIQGKCLSAVERESVEETIRAYFKENRVILTANTNLQPHVWVEAGQCLWQAPHNMRSKVALEPCYQARAEDSQMSTLTNFFQCTLKIPDASYQDLIDELRHRRQDTSDESDFDDILSIYEYLHKLDLSSSESGALRSAFASSELIYREINGQPKWHKSAECLWASTTDIPDKVTLNDHYGDLEQFFIGTVGVKRLTLQMLIDHLVDPGLQASVNEMKSMIWSLNALIQAEGTVRQNPAPLLAARIFPVAYPLGSTELVSAASEFAIVDRDSLMVLFREQIQLLDFSLEDVRRLRPFLTWTELTGRFLSESVREVTSISQGSERQITKRDRDLKRKAYGLLRIAATFNSPRYRINAEALYELFRGIETIETDSISTTIRVFQNGVPFEAQKDSANFYISESCGQMRVYVPVNKKDQDLCFGSSLPRGLAGWLMRHPETQISDKIDAEALLALSTLLAIDAAVVDPLLESCGIIQVPIAEIDESEDNSEFESIEIAEGQTEVVQALSDSRGAITASTTLQDSSDFDHDAPEENFTSRLAVHRFRSEVSVYTERMSSVREDSHYAALLQRVTRAARRATFPCEGTYNMTGLRSSLSIQSNHINYDGIDHALGLQNSSQLERNVKVGAAGELYVFELLSRTGLRGWSRSNWQSTIRRWVTVHPDYCDMTAWHGSETADFTYDDVHGDLTHLLINHGYLSGAHWSEARPYYFLEVKTTTGPNHTPFYMSKNQYRRMQDVHRAETRAEIYLVLRVHELHADDMRMVVYLDPEKLRQDNSLVFTAEGWSVVPGGGT